MIILFVKTAALAFLRAEMALLFLRAILSWIPVGDSVYGAVEFMTEPVIAPVRKIVDKIMPDSSLPIDISFIAAYVIVSIFELILSAV